MDYLGHANLATFTFTLQYEDAPAQKFVDVDSRSLVKVYTVFCVKMCQTFPDFVGTYLVVLGKSNGDTFSNFSIIRRRNNNLELKNFSNIHL